MKRLLITKFLVISILLTICAEFSAAAQDLVKEISQELCDCIRRNEFKDPTELRPCYDEFFKNNLKEINAYYQTESLSEAQYNEFATMVAATSERDCQYIKDNFPLTTVGETRTKQANVNCDDLKNGEFYYLNKIPGTGVIDTTFFTISGDTYMDQMKNKTTYSKGKIVWREGCKYDLIFEESNDPYRSARFAPGDVYSYEVIANEAQSFFAEILIDNKVFQFQVFKINR